MHDSIASLEERYRASSPRSRAAFERACAVMPGGAKGAYFHPPYPLTMARGEGCALYDVDGRRFVDFANHHTAQILGHRHPAVLAAIQEQLERGIALGAPVGVETELAEEMCRRVASVEKLRFCNSGTEATLHAVRLARGFSGRPKIAKFEGGYHGSHDAVEVSVSPPLDRAGPETAPHAVPNAGGMSPHAAEEAVILPYDDEAAVERLITQHRHELACVIFDPKAGILPQRPAFVQAVREITRTNEVLLIVDEIVGFRVGTGGLQESYDITPDLTTFGKIIGGGFPVGAFGGRADIMGLLDTTRGSTGFFQSGTFSAHPVAMAAGLATLRHLTPEAFARLNGLGERLCARLNDLFARRQTPVQAVGLGSLFSIHCASGRLATYRDLARADSAMAHRLFLALLEHGYFLSHGLVMNALSLAMDETHVDGLVEAIDRALASS
ncbi:MAG: aminotransferase class III-fold pyridoxal phosphate-dependent enzyme [Candidatus Latescibacteria bacterium]|nr:aminotransferase class III-fold pyridoxal phosphate-dependent enzyme [Candidatus Latescibacterota bacterium]